MSPMTPANGVKGRRAHVSRETQDLVLSWRQRHPHAPLKALAEVKDCCNLPEPLAKIKRWLRNLAYRQTESYKQKQPTYIAKTRAERQAQRQMPVDTPPNNANGAIIPGFEYHTVDGFLHEFEDEHMLLASMRHEAMMLPSFLSSIA